MKKEDGAKVIEWQNLSKKERRRFKRKQKRLEKEKRLRKSLILKWGLIFSLITLLIGGFFLFKYLNQRRFENAPKIQVDPKTYDFGKTLASKGKVETSFEVKNVGASPLVISGMETSCDCTTAKLRMGGKESPVFGMHGNPAGWSVSIEPSAVAELIVIFDPNFHKDVYGPVTRVVSISSNDPWRSEEKVTVYADVER